MMIELADVVRQLRSELDRARVAGEGEDLRFELGPIELEVAVGLEREAGASGKVRFWVVELGADAGVTATTTQRIKLTLQPTLGSAGVPASGAPRVSVYVSGEEDAKER